MKTDPWIGLDTLIQDIVRAERVDATPSSVLFEKSSICTTDMKLGVSPLALALLVGVAETPDGLALLQDIVSRSLPTAMQVPDAVELVGVKGEDDTVEFHYEVIGYRMHTTQVSVAENFYVDAKKFRQQEAVMHPVTEKSAIVNALDASFEPKSVAHSDGELSIDWQQYTQEMAKAFGISPSLLGTVNGDSSVQTWQSPNTVLNPRGTASQSVVSTSGYILWITNLNPVKPRQDTAFTLLAEGHNVTDGHYEIWRNASLGTYYIFHATTGEKLYTATDEADIRRFFEKERDAAEWDALKSHTDSTFISNLDAKEWSIVQ